MNDSKITSITLLRAIAALLVCFVHIQIFSKIQISPRTDEMIDNGRHGVEIFFVISGFILPYSLYKKNYALKDFFSFLLRRSARIDPPYWCIIALSIFAGVIPVSIVSFKSVALRVLYLVPFSKDTSWYLGSFWTLSVEFQFYLLLGVFFPFLMRINTNISVIILMILTVICLRINTPFHGVIIEQMHCFSIGFIAFMTYVRKISLTRGLAVLLVLSAYLMIAISIKTGAIPLLPAIFILFYKGQYKFQPLYFLGNISYSLYLIHMPVTLFLVQKFSSSFANKPVLCLACLFASILLAYVFYLLVERYAIKLSKVIGMSR